MVSGWFCDFNKVEWSKRFTPGEGKMSNMPKAKAESPHIKWISQRKRLNHFPYVTFQLTPSAGMSVTHDAMKSHRGHNMFQYNRPVKFDIFPHLFFLPCALSRHVRFPIWPRSSWPSVPPCEPSCFSLKVLQQERWQRLTDGCRGDYKTVERQISTFRRKGLCVLKTLVFEHFKLLWVTIYFENIVLESTRLLNRSQLAWQCLWEISCLWFRV